MIVHRRERVQITKDGVWVTYKKATGWSRTHLRLGPAQRFRYECRRRRVTTGPDNPRRTSSRKPNLPTGSSHRRPLFSPPYRPRGRSPPRSGSSPAPRTPASGHFPRHQSSISHPHPIFFVPFLTTTLFNGGGSPTVVKFHCPGLWTTNFLACYAWIALDVTQTYFLAEVLLKSLLVA
jgi:hypothetical protein